LSRQRTPRRKFSTLTRAVAGSTIAVAAIASGTAASLASAPDVATQATTAGPPHVISAPSSRQGTVMLDAFTRPLTADAPAATQAHLTPRQIARSMLHLHGWSSAQFKYLNWLWNRESGWNPRAYNPYSGAYGIPQADPGSKMASAGPNWRTNASTQIRWGMRYIKSRYGSPRQAWNHEIAYGWY
jgi:resuscitation-promoting factor RpfB